MIVSPRENYQANKYTLIGWCFWIDYERQEVHFDYFANIQLGIVTCTNAIACW